MFLSLNTKPILPFTYRNGYISLMSPEKLNSHQSSIQTSSSRPGTEIYVYIYKLRCGVWVLKVQRNRSKWTICLFPRFALYMEMCSKSSSDNDAGDIWALSEPKMLELVAERRQRVPKVIVFTSPPGRINAPNSRRFIKCHFYSLDKKWREQMLVCLV